MSINVKQFIVDFYGLPIEKNSVNLKKSCSMKEYLGTTQDLIEIVSDREDSFFNSSAYKARTLPAYESNQPILVNNQQSQNNTRVIIVKLNELASSSKVDKNLTQSMLSLRENGVPRVAELKLNQRSRRHL